MLLLLLAAVVLLLLAHMEELNSRMLYDLGSRLVGLGAFMRCSKTRRPGRGCPGCHHPWRMCGRLLLFFMCAKVPCMVKASGNHALHIIAQPYHGVMGSVAGRTLSVG